MDDRRHGWLEGHFLTDSEYSCFVEMKRAQPTLFLDLTDEASGSDEEIDGSVIAWEDRKWKRRVGQIVVREATMDAWRRDCGKHFMDEDDPSGKMVLRIQCAIQLRDLYDTVEDWRYAGWYMYTYVTWDVCCVPKEKLMLLWRKLVQANLDNTAWATYFCIGHENRKKLIRWEIMVWGFYCQTELPVKYQLNKDYGTYDLRRIVPVK